MKREYLTILLSILMSMAASKTLAQDYGDYAIDVVDGIRYIFYKYNNTAYVSGFTANSPYYVGDVVIPETVTYKDQTYNVTKIGLEAFYKSNNLTSVIIPNSVKDIEDGAFMYCSKLASVTIPSSVTSIGNSAFLGCKALTSVTIPDGVKYLAGTFNGCSSLTSVHLPKYLTHIGPNIFYNCSSLTSVTIPNSVIEISSAAFYGCSSLTSVNLPEGLYYIGIQEFEGCTNLTNVNIPSKVRTIYRNAFKNCTSLTSVTIPQNVTTIEDNAFEGCKLKNMLIRLKTPPNGDAPFSTPTSKCHDVLYVPIGAKHAYAYNISWSIFKKYRETAIEQHEIREDIAYNLMDAKTFNYAIYDPTNNRIETVSSSGLNEIDPNHCWQTVEISGRRYLYNIGAKKFAIPSTDENSFMLSEEADSCPMTNGDLGIVINGHEEAQWALVVDESMIADKNLKGSITAIRSLQEEDAHIDNVYNLQGQLMGTSINDLPLGIYIVGGKKVMVR